MKNEGRVAVELRLQTAPLAILITISGCKRYAIPLDAVAAQSLALALFAQPGVGGDVLPGVLEQYFEAKAKLTQSRAPAVKADCHTEIAYAGN